MSIAAQGFVQTSTRIRAMPVVRLRGPLKRLADDRAEHAIDGKSVAELLRELEREHPATCGWILDERGAVRPHINVFVNGELGDPDTAVAPDDKIDVLPALSGGR
jgi:sulfur-carrier protein